MSLVNAKARFGLEGDKLYDYLAGRYVKLTGGLMIEDEGGVWDAMQVASLIRAGKSIESAFAKRIPVVTATDQANADFNAEVKRAELALKDSEAMQSEASGFDPTAVKAPDAPLQLDAAGESPSVV